MNSNQLRKILESDVFVARRFLGVFPADLLPNKNGCFVANTDPASKPGSHWVCFNINNGSRYFFDSYGRPPTMFKKKCEYNRQRLQSSLSSCCGQYVIFFLVMYTRGIPISDILGNFSTNYEENDEIVVEFVNEHFDIDLPTIDNDFIISQIAGPWLNSI